MAAGFHPLPVNWDWRQHGILDREPPFQRGNTCWAHVVVDIVEASLMHRGIYNVTPSIQELIDCCLVRGSGTDGGSVINAFRYIMVEGVTRSNVYPETAEPRGYCRRCNDMGGNFPAAIKIRGFNNITGIPEHDLMAAVFERPLVVGVYCGGQVFDEYSASDGILSTGFYEGPGLNIKHHAMLLIGYGYDHGVPYWLIRNSYGPAWGDYGCVKVHRSLTYLFDMIVYPVHACLV